MTTVEWLALIILWMAVVIPVAVWFGIQIGMERTSHSHNHPGCPMCIIARAHAGQSNTEART